MAALGIKHAGGEWKGQRMPNFFEKHRKSAKDPDELHAAVRHHNRRVIGKNRKRLLPSSRTHRI